MVRMMSILQVRGEGEAPAEPSSDAPKDSARQEPRPPPVNSASPRAAAAPRRPANGAAPVVGRCLPRADVGDGGGGRVSTELLKLGDEARVALPAGDRVVVEAKAIRDVHGGAAADDQPRGGELAV